jgi:hypothetical protein
MVRRITARELAGGEVNPRVRPSDYLALKNLSKGMEGTQRQSDKENPKELPEDKFSKGGMVDRDYAKGK